MKLVETEAGSCPRTSTLVSGRSPLAQIPVELHRIVSVPSPLGEDVFGLDRQQEPLRNRAPLAKDAGEQRELDQHLRDLDGTPNKSRLGANAILAVSIAYALPTASSRKRPLCRHLGGVDATLLPMPSLNVIHGGRHADSTVDFQEFKIVPQHATRFAGRATFVRLGLSLSPHPHARSEPSASQNSHLNRQSPTGC